MREVELKVDAKLAKLIEELDLQFVASGCAVEAGHHGHGSGRNKVVKTAAEAISLNFWLRMPCDQACDKDDKVLLRTCKLLAESRSRTDS